MLSGEYFVQVFILGIRSWILGDYAKRLEGLEKEVKDLRQKVDDLARGYQDILKELLQLQKSLEAKADKKETEGELESLSKLVMAVYDKIKEMETVNQLSLGESLDKNEEELLVLDYLRQGYSSPSELLSRLKFGNKKLYAILKRLKAKGKVRKLRKGKRVYYVLIEE